jgi:hypothetical protein
MAEENEKLGADSSAVTEPFLVQGSFWSLFAFFALGSDPEKKYMHLKEQYPLLIRNGWDAIRSATFNATHEVEGTQESSKRHLAPQRTVMHHITASPFPMHTLITRLHQLGVVAWIQGAYDQIALSGDHFLLQGEKAHALIAARILTAKTEPYLQAFSLSVGNLPQQNPSTIKVVLHYRQQVDKCMLWS